MIPSRPDIRSRPPKRTGSPEPFTRIIHEIKAMTDTESLLRLRRPTPADPLRVLMSACLTGLACGYDGSAYGHHPGARKLLEYDTVRVTRFCPEDFSFGTPRAMCDIHGGTGLDVLEGRARVLTEHGEDWTEGMVRASLEMLALARRERIEVAVMMDVSAACGSQVIYDGNRFAEQKVYQIGAGVCAAQLLRHGFTVISQRDFASLDILFAKADAGYVPDPILRDHHQTDWYRQYFFPA